MFGTSSGHHSRHTDRTGDYTMTEHKILKFGVIGLWVLTVFIALETALYFIPRTVSEVVEPVPLASNTYQSGDVIIGEFENINYTDAIADYERVMRCVSDDPTLSSQQINLLLADVTGVPITKSPREVVTAQITPVPEVGFKGVCYIDITGFYTVKVCLLYTSPSPRDGLLSRMPSSA